MKTFKLYGLLFIILCGCNQNEPVSDVLDYQIIHIKTNEEQPGTHVSACVISQAPGAESRKNTLISAGKKLHEEQQADYYFVTMANHEVFCDHEGRLTAIGMYSVNKTGWYGNNLYTHIKEKYEWKVLTTDHPNTPAQIQYTVEYLEIYEKNKARFKEQYGGWDYYDPLGQFVEKQISKQPEFVTSGLWVDDYYIE